MEQTGRMFAPRKLTKNIIMVKSELVKIVASKINKPQKDVSEMFEKVLAEISDALDSKETVTIKDFGTFKVVTSKAKTCINPQTKEKIEIPEKEKVKFIPYGKIRLYSRKV